MQEKRRRRPQLLTSVGFQLLATKQTFTAAAVICSDGRKNVGDMKQEIQRVFESGDHDL